MKLLRRSGRSPRPDRCSARSPIERLEPRSLLSAAPALSNVEMLGTANHVTGVVLTFSAALNASTAQDARSYVFGRVPVSSSSDFNVGDLFGFSIRKGIHPANAHPRAVRNGKIVFSSAVYDDTTDSVTLTPVKPFRAQAFFRHLRIRGTGTNALLDASGNPYNGGVDQVIDWKVKQGKTIHYTDGSGDKLTFKLHGPGQLFVFFRRAKIPYPVIFIDGAKARTQVTATLSNPKVSNSVVVISQLEGATNVTNNLLSNPSFTIEATTN